MILKNDIFNSNVLFFFFIFFSNASKNKVMGKKVVKFNQLTTRYLNEFLKGLKFIKINSKVDMYVSQINNVMLNNLKIERNLTVHLHYHVLFRICYNIFIYNISVIFQR